MKYLDFAKSNAFIRTIGSAMAAGSVFTALKDGSSAGFSGVMLPANIANLTATVREIILMNSEDFDKESYDEAKNHPEVRLQYAVALVLSAATLIMLIIKLVQVVSEAKKEEEAEKAEKKAKKAAKKAEKKAKKKAKKEAGETELIEEE